MRRDGTRVADLRPLVRLNVAVVVERDGRRETGSYGTGGRFAYDKVTAPAVVAGCGGRGVAPGAGQSGQPPRSGRRNGGRAWSGLARHPAA